jgi:hypothetical protein
MSGWHFGGQQPRFVFGRFAQSATSIGSNTGHFTEIALDRKRYFEIFVELFRMKSPR